MKTMKIVLLGLSLVTMVAGMPAKADTVRNQIDRIDDATQETNLKVEALYREQNHKETEKYRKEQNVQAVMWVIGLGLAIVGSITVLDATFNEIGDTYNFIKEKCTNTLQSMVNQAVESAVNNKQ